MNNHCEICNDGEKLNNVCHKHNSNICNKCLECIIHIQSSRYIYEKDYAFQSCLICISNSCTLSICGHKCNNSIQIINNKTK